MNSKLIIAVLLVTGTIPFVAAPAANARHFSAGAEDAVLVSPVEEENNPSVPPDGDFFTAATSSEETDEDAEQEAHRSLEAEAACGLLVYNEGKGSHEQVSPPDQTYNAQTTELRFDAVYTTTVSSYGGVSGCTPFCPEFPGRAVYDTVHDTGNMVGLTEDSEDADYDTDGNYVINANLLVPHSTVAASQATGEYENNGWLFPVYDETIVAFLEERDESTGEFVPVGPDRLEAIVAAEQGVGGNLDSRATSEVCLYSADQKITTGASDVTSCETGFEWVDEPEQDPNGPVYQGPYTNRCSSPTYSCGQLGPYWQANVVCSFGLSVCVDHDKADLVVAAAFERDGYDTTRDYDVWHYAVAPVQSACNGDQEPGFLFDSTEGASFLAHDLDVYEPATAPANFDQLMPVEDWQRAFYDENNPAKPIRDTLLPIPVRTLATTVDQTSTFDDFSKVDRAEPNAAGDTSQQLEVIPRDLESDPCAELVEADVFGDMPNEDDHTSDPWVNIASNDVSRDLVVQNGDVAGIDLFNNDADHQDADNRPGPSLYYNSGAVGMFTDKNDDGDYDQAGSSEALTEIQRVGAYPMYYDMWVAFDDNGDPQVDDERGCLWSDDKGTLPGVMASAGYGMRTGLIQAVLLNEPTALVNYGTNDVFNFTEPGPKVFLFATQAIHALSGDSLVDFSDGGDGTIDGEILDLLDTLPVDTAQAELIAANELELSADQKSDFGDQCGTSTGSYLSNWAFLHDCTASDCTDDTIATAYTFELEQDTIGEGGDGIPFFQADGETDYEFGAGQHTWVDVDPFDNDPDRNFVEDAAPCSSASTTWTDPDFGNRSECPGAASGLTATESSGSVQLSWDTVDNANAYLVKRTNEDDQTVTRTVVSGASTTSYTDTDVTSGTTYTYEVAGLYQYQNLDAPDRPGPFTLPQTVTIP